MSWETERRRIWLDPYWDDLKIPASSINPVGLASEPDYDTVIGGWLFDSTLEEVVSLVLQLPHSWKVGSQLYPHVHYTKTTSASGGVVWKLQYRWAPIGEVFDASWTSLTSSSLASGTPDNDTANEHLICQLGTIPGVGKGISDMLIMQLSRDPTDDADTYGADARLLEFDIHYAVDTPGSDGTFSKTVP